MKSISMASSKYAAPRRKKRVYCSKESPFPVPIESITQEAANADTWFYYTAYISGKNIIVRHSGDINFLFKMGFFGKGNLSRSQPDFSARYRRTRVPHPADPDLIIQPRVQSRRVYKQHMKWADPCGGEQTPSDCDSVPEEEEMESNRPDTETRIHRTQADRNFQLEGCSDPLPHSAVLSDKEEEEENFTSMPESKKAVVSWDTKPDEDFWGCSDGEKDSKLVEPSWDNGNADVDFWNSEEISNKLETNTKDKTTLPSHTKTTSDQIVSVDSCETTKCENSLPQDSNIDKLHKNISEHKCSSDVSHKMDQDQSDLPTGDHNEAGRESPAVEVDPQCECDDDEGDVLVIADSDEESRPKSKRRRKKWKPVLKQDPYPVIEHLQLNLEEAFFLAYGLGCLVVVDEKQEQLNLLSMWQRFCSTKPNFLANYIAYHYYRSKGWVPKTGLKFGCDFIVYKEGPPFYHGSYSVMVRLVDEETQREDSGYSQRHLSWISLSGLNRITEHVAKELLVCYVIKPRGIALEALSSPSCIPQFKVQEMLVSRWVSAQERQEKEVEEFP